MPQVAPKVGLLSACVPTATPTLQVPQPECAKGDPQSPAAASGLKAGDRVVSVDGRPITELGPGLVGDP